MEFRLKVGDVVRVLPHAAGGNNIRRQPRIPPPRADRNANVIATIPQNVTLAILPRPGGVGGYPHYDGTHTWYWVRSRSDERENGRYKIFEGWMAMNEHSDLFVERMSVSDACPNQGGIETAIFIVPLTGRSVYVLPEDGLNIRSKPGIGQGSEKLHTLLAGEVSGLSDGPQCADDMTWWKVGVSDDSGRSGWISEGRIENGVGRRYLAPMIKD